MRIPATPGSILLPVGMHIPRIEKNTPVPQDGGVVSAVGSTPAGMDPQIT